MDRLRILLVDDHALFREALRHLLSVQPDFEVVGETANGLEAVALASSLQPDVILMDVVMPRLNGIEATRLIKRSQPGTAVLVVSAFDEERYIIALLEAGAAGYLLKQSTGQELVQAIRAVSAGEAVMHPVVTAKLLARAGQPANRPQLTEVQVSLTDRELDVLKLAAGGLSNKEIAVKLALSVPTVKVHLVNAFNKMGVGSRTEAVVEAVRQGWIDVEDCRPATEPDSDYSLESYSR